MVGRQRRVVWTEYAYRTLQDAVSYIDADSPQAGRALFDKAARSAVSLTMLSERGRAVPELGDPSVREIFVDRYRLVYKVTEAEVVILAFIHGARDVLKRGTREG